MFPKIGGKPPKWMVKIMENPIKMDDLGVFPYFWKHPYILLSTKIQGIWPCTFAVMVTTPFVTTRRNAGNVEGRPSPGTG